MGYASSIVDGRLAAPAFHQKLEVCVRKLSVSSPLSVLEFILLLSSYIKAQLASCTFTIFKAVSDNLCFLAT